MAKLVIRQGKKTLAAEFEPPARLSAVLSGQEAVLPHPCGGRGICGKCAVLLAGAAAEPDEERKIAAALPAPELPAGRTAAVRLSCQTILLGDAEVTLPEPERMEQIEITYKENVTGNGSGIGAAIDIGTTTLVLGLFDLSTGKCLVKRGMPNPQRSEAADVMGRISAALDGRGEILRGQVTRALGDMLRSAQEELVPGDDHAGSKNKEDPALPEIRKMTIVGNTTMLYLLLGKDPVSLSRAPFAADDLFGRTEEVLGIPSYIPVCMHAFVGADITAAVLSSGMCGNRGMSGNPGICGNPGGISGKTALLIDVGTNGEITLLHGGKLYVTSTAAGPAFEGAGISCGMSSSEGAVDKVYPENGLIRLHTIGETPPRGMCGSGLLDAIAVLLKLGRIDETGAAEEEDLELGGGIRLIPADIRAVQLAKSAIRAGIETILKTAGISCREVAKLYIAGGFGSHLSPNSAAEIGLIPKELSGRAAVLGNAAFAGAAEMLLNEETAAFSKRIAEAAVHVDLGGNPLFADLFIENMMFDAED